MESAERQEQMLAELYKMMAGKAANVLLLPQIYDPDEEEKLIAVGCSFLNLYTGWPEGFIVCEFPEDMYLGMHPRMFARVISQDLQYGIEEARRAK